jgi:hypothetical protein
MKLADQILLHLLKHGRKDPSEIMIPNFYCHSYEMDLFKLTKNGYIVEYEVKISRADYFNDFKKSFKLYNQPEVFKHQNLEQGRSANRFTFVVPEGLIEIKEVPKYAGLMYYYNDVYNGTKIITIKPAPLLHRNEFQDFKSLATSLSWREERWRIKAGKK